MIEGKRAMLAGLAAALLGLALHPLGAEAPIAAPAAAVWKEESLMRAYVKKAGLADRLELYRSWLAMASIENPSVSEELGIALAADLPSLDPAKAREIAYLIALAMPRARGFWSLNGEARGRLVGALLDRPEQDLFSSGLSLSVFAPSGFPLTKKRAAGILAAIGEGRRALPDAESRVLWAAAWSSISKGGDASSARALAARVVELSRSSFFTWSSRLPAVSLPNAASALSDPKLPPGESRLFLAVAGAAAIDELGAISISPRYAGDAASRRLLDAKIKSGDQAYRDLETLSNGRPNEAPRAFDAAALKALGDWEAGLALLRAIPPAESELVALLDPSRPSQAAAAASLLSGSTSPSVVAALSAVVKDDSARDPALLIAAIAGLGESPDSLAVDALGARLLDPGEAEDVKRACAKSLGLIGDARTAQFFVKFLLIPPVGSDSDSVARVYAAMSLGQRREKAAVDALLKNIDPTREEDLNYHCIAALGRIADSLGLGALLPLVRKGLPVWKASAGTRTPAAAYWALLPLEPGLARRLYLERWDEASLGAAKAGLQDRADGSAWYSALYLLSHAAEDAPERGAWSAYLDAGLAAAVSENCSMAGEAIDRFPLPVVLARAAALLPGLDAYSKSWIASSLIHHPDVSMIPAFRSLLDCEDDYLAYAALAGMDHLFAILPNPLTPALEAQLADFRARLQSLSPVQLSGGTKNWRDVVRKRLDGILLDSSAD